MAQLQHSLHRRTAQVEVAILQPRRFIDIHLLGNGEGGGLTRVQNLKVRAVNFHLARGQIGVLRACRAAADHPADAKDELAAHFLSGGVCLGVASLGLNATWTMPLRSRSSMKIRPPRSRTWCAHPITVTSRPTWFKFSSPQW